MHDARIPAEPATGGADAASRARPSPSREALVFALALTALAVSARVSVPVPGSAVPQSLQTLAVVLVGASLGSVRGSLALVLYLLVGAAGGPVFADGAAGAAHLVGPTGGYLIGFVLAAGLVGWGTERDGVLPRASVRAFLFMALGHAIILALGWLRLSVQLGVWEALEAGVLPFLWGGVAKSAVGAAAWTLCYRWLDSAAAAVEPETPSTTEPGLETNA